MTSLSLYTKLETLPSSLKKKAKKFIEDLLEGQNQKLKNEDNTPAKKERLFGSLKGKIHLSDDFDAPIDDFKDYM